MDFNLLSFDSRLSFYCMPFLVSLLVFMMPSIEINVEHNDWTGRQSSQQISVDEAKCVGKKIELKSIVNIEKKTYYLLLVVCQCQRTNGTTACWKCVQRCQIECSPHFNNATITGCHQIFTVTWQYHALKFRNDLRKFQSIKDIRFYFFKRTIQLRLNVLRFTCKLSLCDSCRNRLPLMV